MTDIAKRKERGGRRKEKERRKKIDVNRHFENKTHAAIFKPRHQEDYCMARSFPHALLLITLHVFVFIGATKVR